LTEALADGPGESWLKPIVDLVKGEHMTPTQRLFTVADTLFDERGAVGSIQQSVLVRRRPSQ
jgi:hypothetical protein